jgi:vancomycin permeability regulator SanA
MALREVASAIQSHGIKVNYEVISDPNTRRAFEEVERLLRRLVNDIVRNTEVNPQQDYTGHATIDRTLLASPGTIANNNNVLAALVTDLITQGLIK